MVLRSSLCSQRDGLIQLVFLLGMPHIFYLSQNKHLLVLKRVFLLEAYEDSSSQHGQVGGARANPYFGFSN
jgi:hypothetical protein